MAHTIKSYLLISLLGPYVTFAAPPASLTWVGSTSSMNTASNWSPAQVPNTDQPHDTLTFGSGAGPSRSVVNDILGSLLIGDINIQDNYIFTGANSFTINDLTGYLLNFTGTGANINIGTAPGVILNGTWQVTSTAGGNTIGTVIQGGTTGNFYLVNGTLILGGDNQYNGVLTVGNEVPLGMNPPAILRASVNHAFGSSAYQPNVTVSSTSILDVNGQDCFVGTLGGTVGSEVQLGAGSLTVTNGSAETPFYGVISGGGDLIVSTNGLALMSANTYTGSTLIELGGSLDIIDVGATSGFTFGTGNGSLVFGQNTETSVPFTLVGPGTVGVGDYTVTLNGSILPGTPAQAFTKDGPGTLILTGTNTSGGNLHVWGGILNVNAASMGNAIGFNFDSATNGVGTLQIGSGISTIGIPVSFAFPAIIDTNGNDVEITGALQGGHYFIKEGTGKLTLSAIGNNYASKTKISRGILSVTPMPYNTSTQTVFSGAGAGTLQIGADYNPFAASMVFLSDGTIDTNGHAMNITGVVAGNTASTFNKVGANVLTLSGANIYTGPTHVAAGTLRAAVASSSTISELGVIASGAFGIGSNITVDNGATLDFQTFANTVGTLTNNGTVTTSATVSASTYAEGAMGALTLDFPTSSATPFGNIVTTGLISLNGALTVLDSGNYTPTSGTEIILLQSSGSGNLLNGTFSTTTLPMEFSGLGKVQYDYSENKVILGISGCNGDWQTAANGDWANTANWVGGCAPGVGSTAADHDVATFPNVAAPTVTVTLATSGGGAAQSVTLHDINLEATTTAYTIQQFSPASQIILDKSSTDASKPRISMSGGTAEINAPIVLNTDARIYLSAGTLTFGPTTLTSSSPSTLYISEGATTGNFVNNGGITPTAVIMEGGVIQNNGTVDPSTSLTISGLEGIDNPVTVTNIGTMTAGTTFTIGGGLGGTTVTNSGTLTSVGAFTINSGNIANNSGGQINTSSGQTLTLAGGTLTNNTGASLGLYTMNISLDGGALITKDEVHALEYTQSSASTLTLDFPTNMATPFGNILTMGEINLDGALVLTNSGMYMPTSGTEITLLSSTGTGNQLNGKFSSKTLPITFANGSIQYDYSENKVLLDFSNCIGEWQSAVNGNWATLANWVGGCAPGVGSMAADHDTAVFVDVANTAITVTLATTGGGSAQSVTLHNINFNAPSTEFTIQQFSNASQILLDSDGMSSKPRITAEAGTATINAPIVLNVDSRIYLSGGALILGADTTITGGSSTLYISEGATASALTNNGSITPLNLIIEGAIVNNSGTIHPTGALTISGLSGIGAPVTVTNNQTMIAGTDFTIGGSSGGANVVNNSIMNAIGNFFILSDTVTNANGATFGTSLSNMTFSGGTLITAGQVLANTYTQSGSATLQFNVANETTTGTVAAAGQANLGGNVVVNALPGFPTTLTKRITLLTSDTNIEGTFSNISFTNFPPTVIPNIVQFPLSVVLDTQKSVPFHFSAGPQILFTSIAQHNSLITRKSYQLRSRVPRFNMDERYASAISNCPPDQLVAENDLVSVGAFPLLQRPTIQKEENLTRRVQLNDEPWNVYAGPVASFGHVDSKGDQVGFGYTSAGALVGFDMVLPETEDQFADGGIGFIVDYRRQWGNALGNVGHISQDKVHGSFYATFMPSKLPELSFDGILGFAYTWDRLTRNTGIDQKERAKGDTHEKIFDILFGAEYLWSIYDCFSISPLLHLQYAHDYIDDYSEKGAGIYDLHVNTQKLQTLTTSLGARFDYTYFSDSFTLVAEFDAEWQREFLNRNRSVFFTPFAITSIPTVVTAFSAPRDSCLLALDLLTTYSGGWQTEANGTLFLNSLSYDAFFFLSFGKLF